MPKRKKITSKNWQRGEAKGFLRQILKRSAQLNPEILSRSELRALNKIQNEASILLLSWEDSLPEK